MVVVLGLQRDLPHLGRLASGAVLARMEGPGRHQSRQTPKASVIGAAGDKRGQGEVLRGCYRPVPQWLGNWLGEHEQRRLDGPKARLGPRSGMRPPRKPLETRPCRTANGVRDALHVRVRGIWRNLPAVVGRSSAVGRAMQA